MTKQILKSTFWWLPFT